MKRKQIGLIVLSMIVVISLLFIHDYHQFHQVSKLIDGNEIDKIGFTKLNSDGETISIEASDNATLITVNDKDYVVDNDKLYDLLSKYDCVRSRNDYFPIAEAINKVEISLTQNHKPMHILLGEFNIWYESNNTKAYDIINGNILLEEIIKLVGRSKDCPQGPDGSVYAKKDAD